MKKKSLKIAQILPLTYTNGPGAHFAIWVQGCTLKCSSCFNPSMHDSTLGQEININELFHQITAQKALLRGVTFTGGEPLQQAKGLSSLIRKIKQETQLGVIILTGYNIEELTKIHQWTTIKKYVDVCIAGRFQQEKIIQNGLRGSWNKQYLFFTNFYSVKEFEQIPSIEMTIRGDGTILVTGMKPEIAYDIFPNSKNNND